MIRTRTPARLRPLSLSFMAVAGAAIALLASPEAALSHPGHLSSRAGATNGAFLNGALHPLSGLDHLSVLLALAVFIVLPQTRTRLRFTSIAVAMATGFTMGLIVPAAAAPADHLLAAVLVLLGVAGAVGARARLGAWAAAAAAFSHGALHGMDAPASGTLAFSAAALATSLLIMAAAAAALRAGFLRPLRLSSACRPSA